jgi:uncharacterized protein (TIGR02996 family)
MSLADLLAAVVASPRDDAPRLAYADAIEATDKDRAELIRSQVALARPRKLSAEERTRLRKRVRELITNRGKGWCDELPALEGITWREDFTRGFVSFCQAADEATFRREADAIFAATPIEALYFPSGLDNAEVKRLARCPHLANLRTLRAWNGKITGTGVRALADSRYLRRLRSLDLTQNKIGSDGLIALAHSTALRSLTGLHLYGNQIDDAGIIDLATSPLAARLRQLNVGGSEATDAAARALAESPALAHLLVLDINNSSIGDAGLMFLAHSPHLTRLRELYLRHAGIGDAGIAVLLRSPLAPRLRVLDIEGAEITGVTAWQIVRSPDLDRLRTLKMWDCDNLGSPVANALKRRFGKRVDVHADDKPRRVKPNAEAATRAAFLADIRAAPDDDAPRLIYADWLQDHGDPDRAEFIRVQCELARLDTSAKRRTTLARREKKLLTANQTRWTEGAFLEWLKHPEAECPDPYTHKVCKVMARAVEARLAQDATDDEDERERLDRELDKCGNALARQRMVEHQARLPLFENCEFRRGFPDSVTIPELMLPDFATAIRDLGVIRHLAVQVDPEDSTSDQLVGRVIACFDVPRLRTLHVFAVEDMEAFDMVAAWPGAEELTHLEFGFITDVPGDDILRVLAASPYLRKLELLHLYLCESCTEAGVQALIDSPNLPALKTVYLGEDENELPAAALTLLRQRFLPRERP